MCTKHGIAFDRCLPSCHHLDSVQEVTASAAIGGTAMKIELPPHLLETIRAYIAMPKSQTEIENMRKLNKVAYIGEVIAGLVDAQDREAVQRDAYLGPRAQSYHCSTPMCGESGICEACRARGAR